VSAEGPTPTSRREARERALDELLASLILDPDPFTATLLRAAEMHKDKADQLIADRAKGWTLARMAVIDRLVMRLAVAEMLTSSTPTGVILSEAVELATRYSTDESGRFVNGVLAAVARDIR
jgi:transcription antitermination protein NusB